MPDQPDADASVPSTSSVSGGRRGEPPLVERARRIGWVLLALGLVFAGTWRLAGAPGWVAGLGVACGLLGLLAIVNVALVRGLYRQLDEVRGSPPPPDQSM